jgi:hypothetical protein
LTGDLGLIRRGIAKLWSKKAAARQTKSKNAKSRKSEVLDGMLLNIMGDSAEVVVAQHEQ